MAPAQKLAYAIANKKHTKDDHGGGNKGRTAHLFELIEAKLKAQGEK